MYPSAALCHALEKDSRNGRNIDLVRLSQNVGTRNGKRPKRLSQDADSPRTQVARKLLRLSPGTSELGFVPLETGLDTHSEPLGQKADFLSDRQRPCQQLLACTLLQNFFIVQGENQESGIRLGQGKS